MTRAAKVLLAGLVVALAAGGLLAPIRDFDFFWHLRTGEWIAEHRSLPHEYLFSSTAGPRLDVGTRFTMTSYWLSQLALHLLHAAGGFGAIVALRFLLCGLLLAALLARREGDDVVFLGLLALFAVLLRLYLFERPQAFSLVFFAFLLLALERLRRPRPGGARPAAWAAAVPATMLLWANCHGGYLLGQGVIALYLGAEALKRVRPALEPLPAERWRLLLAAGLAGLAASFANPNTWHLFQLAFVPAWKTAMNVEFYSTVKYYRMSGSIPVLAYWALLALGAAGALRPPGRFDLTRFALLAATGAASFTQVRYVAFFAIAALPAAAAFLSRPRLLRAGRWAAAAPALLLGALVLWGDGPVLAAARHGVGPDRRLLPVDAAGFVLANRPEGGIYNAFDWGGYLLWRLAPEKVFIDGRNDSRELLETAERVDNGDARPTGGLPYWKAVFRERGVHYVVTPWFNVLEGTVPHLLDVLLDDPGWQPVYADPVAVVFVEDTPGNRGILARHAIPKAQLVPRLLASSEERIREEPRDVVPYVARGDLLLRLRRLGDARAVYEAGRRIAPLNAALRERLDWLDRQARP